MTDPDRQDGKHVRLDLDERRARAVHAALREALNAQLPAYADPAAATHNRPR
jgi:hypothetical protein